MAGRIRRQPGVDTTNTWPVITVLTESMGTRPEAFFSGVPHETLELLLARLGRCRADWSIEEMEEIAPQLTAHQTSGRVCS